MDKTLGYKELAVAAAREVQLPPPLLLAIVEVESGGDPYRSRIDPVHGTSAPQAARPSSCDAGTEMMFQRTFWGLMQVPGSAARETGFDGWLTELTRPDVNLRTGAERLARLAGRFLARYGMEGVISAWNAGAPRKRPDGKFANQKFVDAVMKAMEVFEGILSEADMKPVSEEVVEEGETNVDRMRKADLLRYAEEKGIAVDSSARVDELRSAIKEAESQ